ncbi:MAG: prolyl aminopeptidase [bacterium]
MNRYSRTLFVGICMAVTGIACHSQNESELWPQIKPFNTGYLKVSDIHEINYELYGNPEGRPVFVLHGGPGGYSSPEYARFFDPQKFLIVQHDQRGCGKSRPYAEIRENTTQYLVEDVEMLRKHLKLGKILIFGGSWGTTLALAYGETYPESVSGMVLRGIFTATKEEIDHYYHGGVRMFFPEACEMLTSSVPESERGNMPKALLERVQSKDPAVRDKYSLIWTKYEFKIGMLHTPDAMIEQIDGMDPKVFLPLGLFENYYMANGCFLEEGQLLNNAHRIADIPIKLVNGRYDMICPPLAAYRLHKLLRNSILVIAEEAGHWMGDKPVERALLEVIRELE